MRIATGIIERIQKHNAATESEMRKFQVRIGINANTDNLVTDINGQKNIAGVGISMAARIMDSADGNQILVGRSVYDTLGYREKYASAFKGYQATVKHGTILDVYQFVSEDVLGLNTDVPRAFKATNVLSETELSSSSDEQIISLHGTETKLLPTAELAFFYMAERIAMAKRRIDHAALAPPIQRVPGPSDKWEEAIRQVLTDNKVYYRYIALLTDPARSDRIKRHLSNPNVLFYFVRCYKTDESLIPALSFILIDELEVIMHYPYREGRDRCYLSIKHQEVGRLFAAYYERLWDDADELS